MSKLTNIRPGSKPVRGIGIAENIFSGVSTLNELEQYGLVRPTRNESVKQSELLLDDTIHHAFNVRQLVQRRFDVGRRTRAARFADYIQDVITGNRLGGMPPVTLYCSDKAELRGEALFLPPRSVLVNIDGETQTEARFILRDRLPDSGDWTLPVTIYHGITEQHAAQILHDVNRYAFPIKENAVAALNSEGNITRLIATVLAENNLPMSRLNRHKMRPVKSRNELTSYRSLINGSIGSVLGVSELHRVNRSIGQINNGSEASVIAPAKPFLQHMLKLIDTDLSIGETAPPLCALFGAIAHDYDKLLTVDEWHQAVKAYTESKPTTRGIAACRQKQDAALSVLGLVRKA